jgi:hypothetical protein
MEIRHCCSWRSYKLDLRFKKHAEDIQHVTVFKVPHHGSYVYEFGQRVDWTELAELYEQFWDQYGPFPHLNILKNGTSTGINTGGEQERAYRPNHRSCTRSLDRKSLWFFPFAKGYLITKHVPIYHKLELLCFVRETRGIG